MLSIFFTILFSVMPACPEEDSNNCSWDGGDNSFVALHTPGTSTDLLIFRDHFETLPTA